MTNLPLFVGTPAFGVAAFNAYLEGNNRNDRPLHIRFWPSSQHDGGSRLVIEDPSGHDIRIPGAYAEICGSSYSGITLLVRSELPIDENGRMKCRLHLVRYVEGTVSMHELKSADARRIVSGAVDDYNGTVYLMSSYTMSDDSILRCISYA
jgi:hypothetical protein